MPAKIINKIPFGSEYKVTVLILGKNISIPTTTAVKETSIAPNKLLTWLDAYWWKTVHKPNDKAPKIANIIP